MAKGSKQKGNKNVFKVAGARSLKAKNKAKAVSTQLKKVTEVTKLRTQEVDKLLSELQDTVRQTLPTNKPPANPSSETKPMSKKDKIDQFNKTEEISVQAIDKLNKMEV